MEILITKVLLYHKGKSQNGAIKYLEMFVDMLAGKAPKQKHYITYHTAQTTHVMTIDT